MYLMAKTSPTPYVYEVNFFSIDLVSSSYKSISSKKCCSVNMNVLNFQLLLLWKTRKPIANTQFGG